MVGQLITIKRDGANPDAKLVDPATATLRDSETEKIGGGFRHNRREFIKTNDTIPITISLPHHLRQLLVSQRLTHFRHSSGEFRGGDVPIPIPIEDPEHLYQLILIHQDLITNVGENRVDQFVEFNGSVPVGIHGGEQSMELIAVGFQTQGAEERRKLEMGEAAVGV